MHPTRQLYLIFAHSHPNLGLGLNDRLTSTDLEPDRARRPCGRSKGCRPDFGTGSLLIPIERIAAWLTRQL
jgi:hypothetical protein